MAKRIEYDALSWLGIVEGGVMLADGGSGRLIEYVAAMTAVAGAVCGIAIVRGLVMRQTGREGGEENNSEKNQNQEELVQVDEKHYADVA